MEGWKSKQITLSGVICRTEKKHRNVYACKDQKKSVHQKSVHGTACYLAKNNKKTQKGGWHLKKEARGAEDYLTFQESGQYFLCATKTKTMMQIHLPI